MGMALDGMRVPRPEIELAPPDWYQYLWIVAVPPDFLADADPAEYHVLLARIEPSAAGRCASLIRRSCGRRGVR